MSDIYSPLYSPWNFDEDFLKHFSAASGNTLVSQDRCYVLYRLLLQSIESCTGDVWECGVYKGGTAAMIASILSGRRNLFLFDTFCGMPKTDGKKDIHQEGDFKDTNADAVRALVERYSPCQICSGLIPDTFAGLENSRMAFAHVDVDIYKSVLDTTRFIWPRIEAGGCMVFDDYGFPSCPGAREAVDEFFKDSNRKPLCLMTGQAIVLK